MDNRKFCPRCHAEVHPEATRCYFCGLMLPKPSFAKRFLLPILKCLGFYGFYMLVQSALTTVITVAATVLSPDAIIGGNFDENDIYEMVGRFMPYIGIFSAAITILGYFLFFKIRKKNLFREIKVRPIRITSAVAMFAFGAAALFAISLGLYFLYALFPGLNSYSNSENIETMLESGNPVLQFINISIVTGIIEEVIFRGLIYNTLKKTMKVPVAVILSAIIFGIAHMNIEQFFYTSLLGILMALVYEKYGTIIAPIIVHATFNGSNYLLGLFNFKYLHPFLAMFVMAVGVLILTAAIVFFSEREPVSRINKAKD